MNSQDIKPGKDYAFRETPQAQVQRVRALEHIRSDKWRVEWVEPDRGLVDFAKSKHLICPWGERKAFLRDERHAVELREEAKRDWPGDDHPLGIAVSEVLESAGEPVDVWRGILSGPPDALERVAQRAGYTWPATLNAYTDRHGQSHHPPKTAVGLAKAFAAAEPATVLLHIELGERKWEIQVREAGRSHILPLLESYRAAWALVRQWASFDADFARLGQEIQRLRELLDQAVWRLRGTDADPQRVATWLQRAARGE